MPAYQKQHERKRQREIGERQRALDRVRGPNPVERDRREEEQQSTGGPDERTLVADRRRTGIQRREAIDEDAYREHDEHDEDDEPRAHPAAEICVRGRHVVEAPHEHVSERAGGDADMPTDEQPGSEARRRTHDRRISGQQPQEENDEKKRYPGRHERAAEKNRRASRGLGAADGEYDETGRDVAEDRNRQEDGAEQREPRQLHGRHQPPGKRDDEERRGDQPERPALGSINANRLAHAADPGGASACGAPIRSSNSPNECGWATRYP